MTESGRFDFWSLGAKEGRLETVKGVFFCKWKAMASATDECEVVKNSRA